MMLTASRGQTQSNSDSTTYNNSHVPVPIAPSADPATKLQEQVQKDSNAQMNQLLTTPAVPSIPAPQTPNLRLDQLNQFKQGD